MPAPTLEEVRTYIGGDAPTPSETDELRLAEAYASAVEGIEGRCLAIYVDDTDPDFAGYPAGVREAIFLTAHRLYTRATSPQGIGGFDALGNVFRILTTDPDVKSALGRYLDLEAMFA